jgi:hypothetical protein
MTGSLSPSARLAFAAVMDDARGSASLAFSTPIVDLDPNTGSRFGVYINVYACPCELIQTTGYGLI